MLKKFKKFLKNTSGSILPTMALLTIPLVITIGAAVDYTNYVNIRNEIQTGIDAANLASAAELENIRTLVARDNTVDDVNVEIEKQIKAYTQNFLDANITSARAKQSYNYNLIYTPETENTQGNVKILANIEYDTIFGGINGEDGGSLLFSDKITEQLTSIVNFGNRTVEIALVMDNSGSMVSNRTLYTNEDNTVERVTRLEAMKRSSKGLVTNLFNASVGAQLPNPVQFSLVPFSGMVNVGKLKLDNGNPNPIHNDNFIDINGLSPVHNENLDWLNTYRVAGGVEKVGNHSARTASGEPLTRFTVFDMLNTEWAGCVEMRPYPHNILDTYISNTRTRLNNNQANRLFVPTFAPDEPDSEFAERPRIRGDRSDASRRRPYAVFGTDHDPEPHFYNNNYLYDFRDADGTQLFTDRNPGNPAFGVRGTARQYERTNWLFKYQANRRIDDRGRSDLRARNNVLNSSIGPNRGCTTQPITPLTTEENTVKTAIDSMIGSGSTNIQQGLTWGWRTLSAAKPFTGGRPITDDKNLKFIILLTDGNNVYGSDSAWTNTSPFRRTSAPNNTQYGAWGYSRTPNVNKKHPISGLDTHRRWSAGLNLTDLDRTIYRNANFANVPESGPQFELIMNAHTNQACRNIKLSGISIFTIAFDVPSTGGVRQLLEACAGSGIFTNQSSGRESQIVSNVTFYHDVTGDALNKAFARIAQSISAIRIAQ